MIYEFMRMMAGQYLCKLSDYYTQNQIFFNSLVVIVGFLWIVYKKKKSDAANY